ncbi:MAG: glycosyltransferase [Mycobacteriales bacterium]
MGGIARVGRRPVPGEVLLGSAALLVIGAAGAALLIVRDGGAVGGLATLPLLALAVKLTLAQRYRAAPVPAPPASPGTVVVIVPVYNEDPALFSACLASLLIQERPPDAIVVVDDGSTSRECLVRARAQLAGVPGAQVVRLPTNEGKRYALAEGLRRAGRADVVVTVDSDTVLEPQALARGLDAFGDPGVVAVTGYVRVLNAGRNLLTRLTELQYEQSFVFQRAAYSSLGAVLCCCGSLSFYRWDVLAGRLEDFTAQRFLGVPVQYGDDRRLTNYALLAGRVVFQDSAVARTMVPERPSHYLRQQVRWTRSFVRESLWLLGQVGPGHRAWWLTCAEVALWGPFMSIYGVLLILASLRLGFAGAGFFAGTLVLAGLARTVRVLVRTGIGGSERVRVLCLAPLFAAMHLVTTPLVASYAFLTLRHRGWGTRGDVEVCLRAPDVALEPVP